MPYLVVVFRLWFADKIFLRVVAIDQTLYLVVEIENPKNTLCMLGKERLSEAIGEVVRYNTHCAIRIC